MNETCIVIRLLQMYILQNQEFGSAFVKTLKFQGGGGALVHHRMETVCSFGTSELHGVKREQPSKQAYSNLPEAPERSMALVMTKTEKSNSQLLDEKVARVRSIA
jgi:hypothetical protein